MADQTEEDEVFDLPNVEFTQDDLVIALNDMVKEYRKLSHSFEEAKAENNSLKSSSAESSSDEQEDADTLKTELSKLQAENEMLRNEISELMAEVAKSTVELSSWNKDNITLQKICENQKQASDKNGIGFSDSEFCKGESSTQSRPAYDKFNKMGFVKADMIYNCFESVKYDNQNSPMLNENGKAGIGFSKPESFKPDWLKNRLEKDKAKASPKPFVHNQSWHNSKKVKSGWKKYSLQRSSIDMASSLYSNAQHVDFDSVLAMDDPGMVSMFEALMASGLRGFLGCPAVVYEDALVDFFENASVRNGVVFSTVGGQIVKISEKIFAESFELPVDGLGDLSEMPKDAIFDARSIVSLSGEQINLSGRKNQMKMPFRLLCDIVAKAISVKAGSFNAITVEKFSLMTTVVCSVKMNWAKFLFGILKKMVAGKSKQAKGFAVQISLLLATFPTVELGEASAFPASKILSKKTVLRFVEQCADMWVKIPRKVVSTEVPLQRQYDDTLPTMSVFFKLLRKRWADVCLEAVEFCAQRLLPVDSIRSCRSLQLSGSVSSFVPRRPTVFELRVSQFCSEFVNLSLFNRISSAEIREFLSAIALEKTVLHGVQCSQDSFSVAPRVQLALEQQQFSSSSSSSSLRFDHTDVYATARHRPTSMLQPRDDAQHLSNHRP
ncbi:hypothetical protein F511_25425 [Dorcoceras hygrometricum]|uniref:Dystroglycan-like n=1 Tax=Dorcoceras hygrometricum TaxID=472368 RepID=A0A2Z7AFB3_9LAMI|nr:hypothetical protein F511_25425 [Dorcoceras hygrometricum]